MPDRHLLIPFAGRSTPACRTALANLPLPNLEALLARLAPADTDSAEVTTLSPPHERALARALGLTAPDGRLPWAAWEAAQAGLTTPADGEGWAVITLCHWDVAIDEVVLGDPAALHVDDVESRALLATARPFFEEDGIVLHPSAQPGRWLARCALFEGLATASLDRAAEQPISAWSAGVQEERTLRRLQNEMQMLLYAQRVNDERTARDQLSINSFWLSGTGVLPEHADTARIAPTVDGRLRAPALQDDGAAWAAAWQALDAGPVAQLLAAVVRGESVTLTLCGDRAAQRWASRPRGLQSLIKRLFARQRPSGVLEAL
jgi:hypothetical protein